MSRTVAVHSAELHCGLPSPGSRAWGYQGGEHLRPATIDTVQTTTDPTRVSCRRCRRAMSRDAAAARLSQMRRDRESK